ncbi:flagellar hook-basal body complex protein FliE [Butyricicoccus faecihominis]|uniref:flagellar hook-basal body complex protein FliE n=1 Tax=Butyricicoccus faecihominis TaxID=1712515 RepID=UPI002479D1E3|nr:flagellar hook-basal body complex protein FliE [Butyricicoccus faecihominis]MCQ5130673.1 flagellar hook-basal body complex protein FliE [Butyricicoccus faecihominis]
MVFIPITPMDPIKTAAKPETVRQQTQIPFENVLEDAVTALQQAQATAEGDAYRLAIGDVDDLAQVQVNMLKAESMVQTTVQLTTRIVNAYKEIMQMQV